MTATLSVDPQAPVDAEVILRACDITKTYGGTHALKGVNFDVRRAKVTTLFGENGAGKSTLMKILAGIETPTSGYLELDGREVHFTSSEDATAEHIAIIHQELSLCANLSVQDNIFMGRELRKRNGAVDYATERSRVVELMERLQEKIDPATLVQDLRLGQQQIVEIARALSIDARILIMDEPTSALSATEVEVLFKVIEDLTAHGVSIVYISHHLEEALHVSDYVVVFRDGSLIATEQAGNVDIEWVGEKMIGRGFDLGSADPDARFGPPALTVAGVDIADPSNPERLSVSGLSLEVREGEIVCIYGLMGAGRTELLETVAGRFAPDRGDILLYGQSVLGKNIAQRLKLGIGLVPEDRQRDGLVQTMSVGHNMSLASLMRAVKGFTIDRSTEDRSVAQEIADVHVKTSSAGAGILSLSGGNQQKVVIGKILLTEPKVILLDEPTRGIDVGAKAEVFALLTRLAEQGLAVLFSTSEVGEAMSIANRLIVMGKGRVLAEFDTTTVTRAQIMASSGELAVTDTQNGSDS